MKHCPFSLKESHWKLRQQHDQHLQREKRQILGSEYKKCPQWRMLAIWEIITDSTKCICSTRISYPPVLTMGTKVLRGTYIIRGVGWENLIYVRWNRLKKWKKRSGQWLTEEKENNEIRDTQKHKRKS